VGLGSPKMPEAEDRKTSQGASVAAGSEVWQRRTISQLGSSRVDGILGQARVADGFCEFPGYRVHGRPYPN